MKTVFAALACGALLAVGAAWAQTGQTFNSNTAGGSTMNPKPPANHTTPAPATTSHARQPSHTTATQDTQDKCRKHTDDKSLSGSARTDYLRRCPNKLAPR